VINLPRGAIEQPPSISFFSRRQSCRPRGPAYAANHLLSKQADEAIGRVCRARRRPSVLKAALRAAKAAASTRLTDEALAPASIQNARPSSARVLYLQEFRTARGPRPIRLLVIGRIRILAMRRRNQPRLADQPSGRGATAEAFYFFSAQTMRSSTLPGGGAGPPSGAPAGPAVDSPARPPTASFYNDIEVNAVPGWKGIVTAPWVLMWHVLGYRLRLCRSTVVVTSYVLVLSTQYQVLMASALTLSRARTVHIHDPLSPPLPLPFLPLSPPPPLPLDHHQRRSPPLRKRPPENPHGVAVAHAPAAADAAGQANLRVGHVSPARRRQATCLPGRSGVDGGYGPACGWSSWSRRASTLSSSLVFAMFQGGSCHGADRPPAWGRRKPHPPAWPTASPRAFQLAFHSPQVRAGQCSAGAVFPQGETECSRFGRRWFSGRARTIASNFVRGQLNEGFQPEATKGRRPRRAIIFTTGSTGPPKGVPLLFIATAISINHQAE